MGSSTARPRAGLFALGASVCQIALLLPSLAFASSLCPEEARDPALSWSRLSVCAAGWGLVSTKGMEEHGCLLTGIGACGPLRDR